MATPPMSSPPSYNQAVKEGGGQPPYSVQQVEPTTSSATELTSFAAGGLSDSEIRRKFIMKVYLILTAQLSVTVAMVAIFHSIPKVKAFVFATPALLYSAIGIFFFLYIILAVFEKIRRSYPGNFFALGLFTLAFSYMTATIACAFEAPTVLMAAILTLGITVSVTLFVTFARVNITCLVCFLMAFVFALLWFALGIIIGYAVLNSRYHDYNYGLLSVYGGIVAIIFALILAIDTWLVVNKDGLSEEEYIFAALQLYIDIVYIFILLLGFSRSSS